MEKEDNMTKDAEYSKSYGSKEIAAAAIRMSMTSDRNEEKALQSEYLKCGIHTAAVDYGGEFINSIMKIIERAVVSSKREGVITDSHAEEGAVAGAAKEALSQIASKAMGLNVGGKIGIARYNDHVSVAIFLGIGLLHLNEVAISVGHRVV
ncbi:MAG TPA: HutP family protein [Pseudobacteroides sp.]|nr:HutP family protein [Pseudobacteroides sp.]